MKQYFLILAALVMTSCAAIAKDTSSREPSQVSGGGSGNMGSVAMMRTETNCDIGVEELKTDGSIGSHHFPLKVNRSGSYAKGNFKIKYTGDIGKRFNLSIDVFQHKLPNGDVFLVSNKIEDSQTGHQSAGGGFLEFDNPAKKSDFGKAMLYFTKNNPNITLPNGKNIVLNSLHLACGVEKQ